MKVVNVRDYGGVTGLVKAGGIYGGRPGPLGNPCSEPETPCPVCGEIHFGHRMVQLTEHRSIPCYRKWLWQRIQEEDRAIIDAMATLKDGDVLGCFCKPKACHLDVVVKAWEWGRQEGLW